MTPRAKFIQKFDDKKLAAYVWVALQLASTHDPDHAKLICDLQDRIVILERQTYRLGAPLYRKVRNGIYAERVRGTGKVGKMRAQ